MGFSLNKAELKEQEILVIESETRMELARARAGVDGRARSRWPKHTEFVRWEE